SNLPGDANLDEADKYRALCFLGLNRAQDAEHALEQLVTRRPLFKLDPFDSPKLVATFRDVRVKVLPTVARTLYGTAKASFDANKWTMASEQFNELLALLAQPEMADQASLADLRLLADGFSKLAAAQQLKAQQSEAPRPIVERPKTEQAIEPRPAPSAARVFGAEDTNVVGPITVAQAMPNWSPPPGDPRTFSGVIEIIIDERGAVTGAGIVQSVSPAYDRMLLAAAKRWQYRPALLNGQPVKYRKAVGVVLRPNN
ncbi:MAG TPA: TonB family protein, partial [Vicinamibacterales bacterium]|nr:TonB family protein [Vicinamibacterales bacterium]